jgi:hypothetical protein
VRDLNKKGKAKRIKERKRKGGIQNVVSEKILKS